MKQIPVHPAAAVLPLLSDDELDALAADIAYNGQREAITILVDADGTKQLLDGRNRLEACRRAGVEPLLRDVTVDDLRGDPAGFVIAKNVHRRHLVKYQRAMIVAMIYPDAPPGPSAASRSARQFGISGEYVRQARAVLRADRALAERVLRAELPLEQAYDSVKSVDAGAPAAIVQTSATSETSRPNSPRDKSGTAPAARSQPPEREEEERKSVRPTAEHKRANKQVSAGRKCEACGRLL